MKYIYKQFNSNKEIENFFSEINKHIYIQVENWYNHNGLYLHGCFYNKEEKGYFNNYLFCFSQTIESNKLQPLKNNLIFSNLKLYGSSHKYKGLKDIRGNVILSNQFDKIELFYTTEITIYFKIEKNHKKGIYKFESDKIENIVPIQFEDFFDAGEYTWGYIKDGNVGFMSLEGKCITEARYKNSPDLNHFINGKALTCLNSSTAVNIYINHYGDFIDFSENDDFTSEDFGLGTNNYPYEDLPDRLDAYEGDESNFWNTDK